MYGDIKAHEASVAQGTAIGAKMIEDEQRAILSVVDEHNHQLELINYQVEELFERFAHVLAVQAADPNKAADVRPSMGSSSLYYQLEEQVFATNRISDKLSTLRRLAEV